MTDPHYDGHRQRLRERFVRSGFDGLNDYEVVELLLTLAIPRSDVKQPAKTLIARFGNLPPLIAQKTLFNCVATYNDFERRFAEFLANTENDVLRFAALGTTEQGESGTQFRVDYLKPSGAIGFYHPDWVVVQKTKAGEVNWIIETKGRVWEGTSAKDEAVRDWCERITQATGSTWRFVRVNQTDFEAHKPTSIADLTIVP